MSKFGLIGKSLKHSHSKALHELIAKNNQLTYTYELLEYESKDDLIVAIDLLKKKKYSGYNVTIPYKEAIMSYCDELSEAARKIQAVNTIYLKDGLVYGDNTDYYGVMRLFEFYHINPKTKAVYILGSGGAAKATAYALSLLGYLPVVVSRDKQKNKKQFSMVIDYEQFYQIDQYPLVINTTPVGMYPNNDDCPLPPYIAKKIDIVIDLIYNPKKTVLMKEANFSCNGIVMLVTQALRSQELWQKKLLKSTKEDIDDLIGGLNL